MATKCQGDEKLQELILYVARESMADAAFGRAKLNQVLFCADFVAYATTGSSISGQAYVKQPEGPVPDGVDEALVVLQSRGDLVVAKLSYHGRKQERPLPLRDARLSAFSGEEIAIVDRVVRETQGRSPKDVSDLFHDFVGWRVAGLGEVIPYETVFLEDGEPTEEQIAHAQTLVQSGR
jgi:hypothetical protein